MAEGTEARYLEGIALWRERDLSAAIERLSSVIADQTVAHRDGWWYAASRALAQIALESDSEDALGHLRKLQGTGVSDAQTLALRARTRFQEGDDEAAIVGIHWASARLADDRSSDVGSLMNGAIALIWCAEVLAELGCADDASALVARARARMATAEVHDAVLQAMLWAIEASIARLVGNVEAARTFLDRVDTSSSPDLQIQVTRERARLARAGGQNSQAVGLYEQCLERADEHRYAFLARSITSEMAARPPVLQTDRAPIGQWDPRSMENVPEDHRPYALVVRLPLREESDVLDLADRVAGLFRDDPGLGHVDGTGTDGRVGELFMDGDDADALWDAVRPLLESTPAWHGAEISKRAGSSSIRFRLNPPGI